MSETEGINILQISNGDLMKHIDAEVEGIVENILDGRTDPKKKRTLTITVDFTPGANRRDIHVLGVVRSKKLPVSEVEARLFAVPNSETGELEVREVRGNVAGQLDFEGNIAEEGRLIRLAAQQLREVVKAANEGG